MATFTSGRLEASRRSDRVVRNIMPTLLMLDGNLQEAGFLAFYGMLAAKPTPQEKFTWDVDDWLPTSDTLSAAVASITQTSIPVTNISYFIPGILWMNKRTGEIILVDSVNTTESRINVIRGVTAQNGSGGTAAANMNSGDTLIKLSPVVGENNRRQVTHVSTPVEVYNYCQPMRWELEASRRQQKRAFDSGSPEFSYHEKKTMNEARKNINGVMLAGERSRYTDPTQGDVTTTAGIRSVISTNVYSVGGTLYEYALDEFLVDQGLRKGSRNKLLMASSAVILALTQIGKDRLSNYYMPLTPQKGGLGVQVQKYMAPNGGEITIMEDRFLSENFNGEAYGIDMSDTNAGIKRRVFSNNGINDDLHIITHTQDKDDLGNASTMYCDMGLEYGIEAAHFKLTGVTGGQAGRSTL